MFNIDELSIIKMYGGLNPKRDHVISILNDVLKIVDDDEIKETIISTIRKSTAMTEEAFMNIDLSDTFETTGL